MLLTINNNVLTNFNSNINKITKTLFIFGSGLLILDYCFKKSPFYKWAIKKDFELYFKTYFFTDKGLRGHEFSSQKELVPITWPLVEFIDKSEKFLDICFYIITVNDVIASILRAKKRKVKVRVIVDYQIGLYNNEYARILMKAGIPIYAKSSMTIMHHKFCVRDKSFLLQSSMNLTQNSVNGSFDNIIITNHKELVFTFQLVFDIMVEQFLYNKELFKIDKYKIFIDKGFLKKYANDETLYEKYLKSIKKPFKL